MRSRMICQARFTQSSSLMEPRYCAGTSGVTIHPGMLLWCQSALKTDPPSAANIDPPEMVFYEALFASRVLILQLWLPVSMMSQ